jgi:DNA-binding response OmpR family regulator
LNNKKLPVTKILYLRFNVLQLKEYKVSTIDNIKNLESFIKDLSPEIILMDMLLCGADGREICKQLKRNLAFSHIPIVMISAHPRAKAECLEAGANYFLEKPFEMNELYQAVSTVLS